jgi:PKD repeat protein
MPASPSGVYLDNFTYGSSAPTPPYASFTDPATPVVTKTLTFTDTSTGSPTAWWWQWGDGTSSITQSPTHQYTSSGTYSIIFTVYNAYGNSATTHSLTVNPLSPVDLVGINSINGTPHEIDLIGIMDITGTSHEIVLIAVPSTGHGVASRFRCELG